MQVYRNAKGKDGDLDALAANEDYLYTHLPSHDVTALALTDARSRGQGCPAHNSRCGNLKPASHFAL